MARISISDETLKVVKASTKSLVMRVAFQEAVDPVIALAVALKESNYVPFVPRYEPGLARQDWFQRALSRYRLDVSDWRVHASHGPMQCLLVTGYGQGYDGSVNEFSHNPEVSTLWGIRYLKSLLKRYGKEDDGLKKALSAYNAGSPIKSNYAAYVRVVLGYMRQIQQEMQS